MAYAEGKSIRGLVKERTLSREENLKIAIQTGEGLDAAHKKDITHRDVKSDNIELTNDRVVRAVLSPTVTL
jgi:serine/threonine protein kinase